MAEDLNKLSEMNYGERLSYITEKYVPHLKKAEIVFNIYGTGFSYDFTDSTKAKNDILSYYKEQADYTEENLEKETDYKVDEDGWDIVKKNGEELEEVMADNTYNSSYLGYVDINYRVYEDKDAGVFVLIAHPHLGGDIRGNYGGGYILIGDSKDEVFYRLYEEFISGSGTAYIEFKDGASLLFDSEQDSDVWRFEFYEYGSELNNSKIAQEFINDFESYDDWYGDEFLEETVERFNTLKNPKEKFALGGQVSDNVPRAYVVSLSDYNDGKSVGKWIEISESLDGEEVMQEINDFLEELNEKDGGSREEYAIHDYEGFGKEYYSEGMGVSEFDKIIEMSDALEGSEFPLEVIEEFKGISNEDDIADVLSSMDDRFHGEHSTKEDFVYELVEDGSFTPSAHNMFITDTDKRIIASENADNYVSDLEPEYLLEEADLKSEFDDEESDLHTKSEELYEQKEALEGELEEVDSEDEEEFDYLTEQVGDLETEIAELEDRQGELEQEYIDKAEEKVRESVYDNEYYEMENNLESWLNDLGYTEDLQNVSFLVIDYEDIADDLEQDYNYIEDDSGSIYVFSNYYEKGGKVSKANYKYFIVNKDGNKIISGAENKSEGEKRLKELKSKHPKSKLSLLTKKYVNDKLKLPVSDSTLWSEEIVEFSGRPSISKVKRGAVESDVTKKMNELRHSIDEFKKDWKKDYGNEELHHSILDLEKELQSNKKSHFTDTGRLYSFGGKVKGVASGVGSGVKRFGNTLKKHWKEADFGDGKGGAKFGKGGKFKVGQTVKFSRNGGSDKVEGKIIEKFDDVFIVKTGNNEYRVEGGQLGEIDTMLPSANDMSVIQPMASGGKAPTKQEIENFKADIRGYVYYTFNYYSPQHFEAFGDKDSSIYEHIRGKFRGYWNLHGANAFFNRFWVELDGSNQLKLATWIKENYRDSEMKGSKSTNKQFAKNIQQWVMFCFNYPHSSELDFMDAWSGSMKEHLEGKFSWYYDMVGSTGVMNYFYVNLDGGNQSILSKWVLMNYPATGYSDGGKTKAGKLPTMDEGGSADSIGASIDVQVVDMLLENTGQHFLDSGGDKGRQWQRNQDKIFQDEPRVEYEVWNGEISDTVSAYHYLTEILETDQFSYEVNKFLRSDLDEEGDACHWIEDCKERLQNSEEFSEIEWIGKMENTYNYENNLSQVFLSHIFKAPYTDDVYCLFQLHGGADVRGGYTTTRCFKLEGYLTGQVDVYGSVDGVEVTNSYNGYSLTTDDGEEVKATEDSEIDLDFQIYDDLPYEDGGEVTMAKGGKTKAGKLPVMK